MGLPAISVYVAERHELARHGIVCALSQQDGIQIVGEAADGITAVHDLQRLRPDVAVLAERLPSLTAGELLRILGNDFPSRIVVLARDDDTPNAIRAFADGASAYLSARTDAERLRVAVAAVARDQPMTCPDMHHQLLREIRGGKGNDPGALTAREREVLTLRADGLRAAEIAPLLNISTATVKKHIAHVHRKLGCTNATAAVARALRERLIA